MNQCRGTTKAGVRCERKLKKAFCPAHKSQHSYPIIKPPSSGKKAKVGASVSTGQGPPSSSSSEPKAGVGPRWYDMEACLTHVMPYLNLTDIVRFHMASKTICEIMRSCPAMWTSLCVPPTHGVGCTLERLLAYLDYSKQQVKEVRIMDIGYEAMKDAVDLTGPSRPIAPWVHARKKILAAIKRGALSQLQSLELRRRFIWQDDELDLAWLEHAPQLRTLAIALSSDLDAEAFQVALRKLKHLERLSLLLKGKFIHIPDVARAARPDTHYLGPLISGAPLTGLRHLCLRICSSWMLGLKAPDLRIMEVYTIPDWDGNGVPHLPQLEHLRIAPWKSITDGSFIPASWQMPMLKTLELDFSQIMFANTYCPAFIEALAAGLPNLQYLRLVGWRLHQKKLDLSPLLTKLPNLWYLLTSDADGIPFPTDKGWISSRAYKPHVLEPQCYREPSRWDGSPSDFTVYIHTTRAPIAIGQGTAEWKWGVVGSPRWRNPDIH